MKALIFNFRISRHTQHSNHMIIQVSGVSTRDNAKQLVGKTLVWKSPAGKELKGKVAAPHGNKGAVRAIFETGMPGQSVGSEVKLGE